MTYNEFTTLETSQKNVLVEIDTGSVQDMWITHEPGVWKWNVTDLRQSVTFNYGNGSFGYGTFGSSGVSDLGSSGIIVQIGSVLVDGVSYTQVTTFSNLRTLDKTFLFDFNEQVVYIHFANEAWPETFGGISLGVASGYSTQIQAVYQNTLYEARVKSIPNVTTKVDPLFFGVISQTPGTVVIDNTDGAFDAIVQGDLFGQALRMKYGGKGVSFGDYKQIVTAYIDDFDVNETDLSISIMNPRKKLFQKISEQLYLVADWPDLDDRDINKAQLLIYGQVYDVEPVCTNKAAVTPDPYTFKISDTTFNALISIDEVRVNDTVVTPTATSLPNGTFSLAAADYDPKDGDKNKVTVDLVGSSITNALDIIVDLLTNYAGATYTNDFFDIGNWTDATNRVSDIGIVIKEKKLIDIIEQICKTVHGVFTVDGPGKYVFYLPDTTALPVKEILQTDRLNQVENTNDSSTYISSISVRYNQRIKEKGWQYLVEDDDEAALQIRYKARNGLDYETLLLSEADAQALADLMINRYGGIFPIFKVEIKDLDVFDQPIYSVVNVTLDRRAKSWYGRVKCELLGKVLNFNTNILTISLRLIGDATDDVPDITTTDRAYYHEPYFGAIFFKEI